MQSLQPAEASCDAKVAGAATEGEDGEKSSSGGDDKPPLDEKELKKQRRLIRNRLSAQLHRERKRKLIESLEEQLRERDAEIADLRARERQLTLENAALRRALGGAAADGVGSERIDGCGAASMASNSADGSSSASSRSGSPDPTTSSATGSSASSSSSDTSSPPGSPPHAGASGGRYSPRAGLALMLPTMLVAAVFISGRGFGAHRGTALFADRVPVPTRLSGSRATLRPSTETTARRLTASKPLASAKPVHNATASSSRALSLLQVPRLRGGAKAKNASVTSHSQVREHGGTERNSAARMRTIPIASTKPRPRSAIHGTSHSPNVHDGYVLCPQAYGKFSLPPDADDEHELTKHNKARVDETDTGSSRAGGGSRSGGHEVAIYEAPPSDTPISLYGRQHGSGVADHPDTTPVMRRTFERPLLMPPAKRGVTAKSAQLRNPEPATASASGQGDGGAPFVAVYVPSSSIEGISGLPTRSEGMHSNVKSTPSTQEQENQKQQQQAQPLWVELGCRVASARVLTGLQLESFASSATA